MKFIPSIAIILSGLTLLVLFPIMYTYCKLTKIAEVRAVPEKISSKNNEIFEKNVLQKLTSHALYFSKNWFWPEINATLCSGYNCSRCNQNMAVRS